jgi:hypothetical protein
MNRFARKHRGEMFAATTLATYRFEIQAISLESISSEQFEQGKQTGLFDFTWLVAHEAQHWLDHISSTWGQTHLTKWFSALNVAGRSGCEDQFWRIPVAKRESAYIGYDTFYKLIRGSPRAGGQSWRMRQSVGRTFDLSGKISYENPIFFCYFTDESEKWMARFPVSIRALTEVTASTVDLIARQATLSQLSETEAVVEFRIILEELNDVLHDPQLLEYSVLFHITAFFLDKPGLIEAAPFAFALAIVALNLRCGDFGVLATKPSLCEPETEHMPLCNSKNRGYAFYYFINMLVARNGEWRTPDEALAVILAELGYDSWHSFAATVVEYRKKERSDLVQGKFSSHCEALLDLGDEVLLNLRECTAVSFLEWQGKLASQVRSAPIVFADQKVLNSFSGILGVGWHDFDRWCEEIWRREAWMDSFLNACIS